MEKVLLRSQLLRILAIDAALVTVALILPVISHAFDVGLRYLEPMRLTLFAAVLFVPEKKNSYFLAFILPWLSCAITGMPIWWKGAMMSFELMANVFILYRLLDFKVNAGLSVFISIIVAKALYYLAKFVLIRTAVLPQIPLVDNYFAILISSVTLSALFIFGFKYIKK